MTALAGTAQLTVHHGQNLVEDLQRTRASWNVSIKAHKVSGAYA